MRQKNESKGSGLIKEEPASYIEDRYEIIEGIRYDFLSSPSINHQKLITELWRVVDDTCHSSGTILIAPLDVYLDDDNHFQPDLIYISHENSHIMKPARVEGVPDLVAEILSPSTGTNDKVRKKRQFERFGVKEYWIVDPIHRIIDQYVLEQEKLVLNATYGAGDRLISPCFACISIDLDKLFGVMIDWGAVNES
ncbi:MAG: hypothetical protein K0R75_2851 [Paenibacillaceae bacterium]|nr:hypothetical protein [Paenibacillaceae bacterium]